MNSYLWIALAAAALVILAHLGLFWLFLHKPRDPDDGSHGSSLNDSDKPDSS